MLKVLSETYAICRLALLAALPPVAQGDSLQESLVYLSEQVHRGYLRQRLLIPDLPPYLGTLLATVTDLYPDVNLRLYLLRLADGNASTLPNGAIYLRQGFLAKIRDPKELIFVLAHEAAHVALEHVAGRSQENPRLDLFSAEVEVEADQEAIRRMRRAGIETAGVRPFLQRLVPDGAALADSQLATRVERIAPQASGGQGRLPAPLVALQLEALMLLLSLDREGPVEDYLSALGGHLGEQERLYLEAELARRRDEFESAETLFRRSIQSTPEASVAWRGLGPIEIL